MVDEPELSCASLLKTLSDDTRLSVVRLLLDRDRSAGDLAREINVEQSLLSHHLRILKDAGIIASSREGKSVIYRLTAEVESRRRGDRIDLGCCELSFKDSPS